MNPPTNSYSNDFGGASFQKDNTPPPYRYGQPMANAIPQPGMPTAIIMQPNVMVVPQPACNDYLALSITNLILCCLPIGIAAVVFSCKTRSSVKLGDMNSALRESRAAFTLNMVALGLGIAWNVAWIIYVIYINVAYSKTYYGYLINNG